VSLLAPEMAVKRLTLLKKSIPSIERAAVLWKPDDTTAHFSLEETKLGAVAGDTASVGILSSKVTSLHSI
jgi:hypothetical protein